MAKKKDNTLLWLGGAAALAIILATSKKDNSVVAGVSDKLSKKQTEIVTIIESVLQRKLDVSSIGKKIIRVKCDQARFCPDSDLYLKIEKICNQYNLGKVEPNGVGYMAIII